jgi:uncharacterized DUF497 family protein
VIYEWDPKKAQENLKKHKVSFDEAILVFADPFALTFDDPDHSADERRFITIGTSSTVKQGQAYERILFVSHTDRGEDRVRIINARSATPTEAYAYQESHR